MDGVLYVKLAQKTTVERYPFSVELDRAFPPFHRSNISSNVYSVHFAGIAETVQSNHAVNWFNDFSKVHV